MIFFYICLKILYDEPKLNYFIVFVHLMNEKSPKEIHVL